MTPYQFFEYILLVIGGLLPIMNPFSTAPLLVALTSGMDLRERNRQILLACIYAFCILVVFVLAGRFIISFFGISLPGIRVAGGILISTIGFRMLFSQKAEGDAPSAAQADIAFSPLAMPMLSGPGSISLALTASAQLPEDKVIIGHVIIITGIALTTLIAWLVLRASTLMVRFLGPSGIDAMTRIFGFLLVCIGVQFGLTGTADFFIPQLKAIR